MILIKPIKFLIITLYLIIFLFGCSSPEEESEKYIESGFHLLESGEHTKAGLQFRNALQIDNGLVRAWYGLSLVEEKQGNIDKVYYMLNKVVDLEPSHIEANIKLGKIMLAGKAINQALEQSNKLMKLAPENANVIAFRASVLLQLSDNDGAIREANNALEKDPDNVDALIVLATQKLASKDPAGAIQYLDKGILHHEKNLLLYLIKIKALDESQDFDGVVKVFKRIIELYPESKTHKSALARYYIANNKLDLAENLYKKIIDESPDDVDTKLELIRFLLKERGAEYTVTQLNAYVIQDPLQYKLKFALAEVYLLNKQRDEALRVYDSIIDSDTNGPNALSAKNKLARMALANDDPNNVRQLVGDVLNIEPNNSEALIILASLELEEGQTVKAIVNLRASLKDDPNSIKALLLLAKAHRHNNSIELAKDTYKRAIRANPLSETANLEYANFLIQSKQLNVAEDVLQAYLEKAPNSIFAMQVLAQIYLRKGNWLAAHELAEYIKNSGEDVIANQILGAVYQGKRQYDQSVEAFKRAYQASPTSIQPIIAVVRSYVLAGKREEAKSFLKSVIDIHPSNLYAHVLLGQGYALDNNMQQAELHLKYAIEYHPDHPLGYLEFARMYSAKNDHKTALGVLEAGLIKLPENLSLNLAMARELEKDGRIESAIAFYEKLLVKNPNIDLAANNMASLLSENYDDEESLKRAFDLAKKFENSSNPFFKDTLGWVYYKMGDVEMASRLFNEVVEEMPGVSVFHYHLGMSLLAEGKKEMAKTELEKAVAISDDTLVDKSVAENTLKNLN